MEPHLDCCGEVSFAAAVSVQSFVLLGLVKNEDDHDNDAEVDDVIGRRKHPATKANLSETCLSLLV